MERTFDDARPPMVAIVVAAMLLLVAVMVWLRPLASSALPTVGVINPMTNDVTVKNRPEHSVKQHGQDALDVQKCLDDHGPNLVWKTRSWRQKIFFQACEVRPGEWGVRIIQKAAKGGWLEKTSFLLGSKERMIEYLSARATIFSGYLSEQ